MKDFIRGLRKNSKAKQNPDMPEPIVEPSYTKRSYSSKELICIFEYALQKDFSNMQAFRINEASPEEMDFFIDLINYEISGKSSLPAEKSENVSRFNVDIHEKARVSLNFSSENIPYILCSVIKFGMMNWDFLHHADEQLVTIHAKFKTDFIAKFDEIRGRIQDKTLDYTAFSKEVTKILSPSSEHRNPQLAYATEKMIIDFIAMLTVRGYHQEAKVLHTFLILSKKIISQAHADEVNQVKTLLMLAMPVLKGLDLWPETDRQANPFITCMMNLALTHSVLNHAYDAKVYFLYSRFNDKSKELGVIVETNPSIFERIAELPINADIRIAYQKSLDFISQHKDDFISQDISIQFFKNVVAIHTKFNPTKAAAIHNFMYVFGEVYRDDDKKDNPHRIKLYAKVLRHALQIPSKNSKLESIFDFFIMRSFIEGKPDQDFKIPYSITHYELSNDEVNRHCENLQNDNREANIKISQLKVEIEDLKAVVKGYEDDNKRLESDLVKMKDKMAHLTLEKKERTSPPSTPPTTPPKERKVISSSSRTKSEHRLRRTQDSHSPQNSPPKEQSLSRLGEMLDDVQTRFLQFSLEENGSKERSSPTHTPHGSPTKDHKHHKILEHTKSESDLKRKTVKPL